MIKLKRLSREVKRLSREVMLARLRELGTLKPDDPIPKWLPTDQWGPALSNLARSAVWHLERSEDCIGQLRHALVSLRCLYPEDSDV